MEFVLLRDDETWIGLIGAECWLLDCQAVCVCQASSSLCSPFWGMMVSQGQSSDLCANDGAWRSFTAENRHKPTFGFNQLSPEAALDLINSQQLLDSGYAQLRRGERAQRPTGGIGFLGGLSDCSVLGRFL